MTSVFSNPSVSPQMSRLRRVFLLMAASLAFTALPLLGQHPSFDITEEGRALSQAFQQGELETVVERFSPELLQLMGGEPELQLYREQIREQFGQEVEMVSEEISMEGDLHVYQRRARFDGTDSLVDTRLSLDIEGRVSAFTIVVAPVDTP